MPPWQKMYEMCAQIVGILQDLYSKTSMAVRISTLEERDGLEINTSKTKIVIFKTAGRNKGEAKVRCGDEIIQVVNEYQYLGVPFR